MLSIERDKQPEKTALSGSFLKWNIVKMINILCYAWKPKKDAFQLCSIWPRLLPHSLTPCTFQLDYQNYVMFDAPPAFQKSISKRIKN